MKKMFDKFKKKNSSNLTFLTVSKKWNSVMDYNFGNCIKNNIPFLWVKHIEGDSENIEFTFSQNSSHLSILECKSSGSYIEALLFKSIQFLNSESWYLRIDSDELLSHNSLLQIRHSITECNVRYVYRIKRLWIQKINEKYFYSNNAKTSGEKYDLQYRLFYSKTVTLDEKIHTPGFALKKFKDLDQDIAILHLVWIIENLQERIKKIQSYENISVNSGVSKIRYYLPEIFSESVHNWTSLNSDGELSIEEWTLHNVKNQID
jgi:hypothetical protein